jgi:hypothetical protein
MRNNSAKIDLTNAFRRWKTMLRNRRNELKAKPYKELS